MWGDDLNRQLERDEEREPRRPRVQDKPRRQFRYWAGHMFRPVRASQTPMPEVFS